MRYRSEAVKVLARQMILTATVSSEGRLVSEGLSLGPYVKVTPSPLPLAYIGPRPGNDLTLFEARDTPRTMVSSCRDNGSSLLETPHRIQGHTSCNMRKPVIEDLPDQSVAEGNRHHQPTCKGSLDQAASHIHHPFPCMSTSSLPASGSTRGMGNTDTCINGLAEAERYAVSLTRNQLSVASPLFQKWWRDDEETRDPLGLELYLGAGCPL